MFKIMVAVAFTLVSVSASAADFKLEDGKYTTKFVNSTTGVVEGCGDLTVTGGKFHYQYRPKCGKSVTFRWEPKLKGRVMRVGDARFEISKVAGGRIEGVWTRTRSQVKIFPGALLL
jgi:hypothetical protein